MKDFFSKKLLGIAVIVICIFGGCNIDGANSLLTGIYVQKNVTITGIPSIHNGRYGVVAFMHQYTGSVLAESNVQIINNTNITVKMYDNAPPYAMEFTADGNYQVHFAIIDSSGSILYWYGYIDTISITGETTGIQFNQFSELRYTVVFNSNGGGEIPALSDLVYGELIAKPADPVKSGYMFAGWYTDSALLYEWDFQTNTVTGNMTLYAKWYKNSETVRITIKDKNTYPLAGVNILGVASNKTTKSGVSNKDGVVFLSYQDGLTITLLMASPLYEGLVKSINTSQNYTFYFNNDTKGSVMAPSGTCYIPGLSGRLNPIKDSLDRLYLYADNIAINGGLQQPVYFTLTGSLRLEDANGTVKNIWIPFIDGDTALINYAPR